MPFVFLFCLLWPRYGPWLSKLAYFKVKLLFIKMRWQIIKFIYKLQHKLYSNLKHKYHKLTIISCLYVCLDFVTKFANIFLFWSIEKELLVYTTFSSMFLQSCCHTEGHVTESTFENPHSWFHMYSHMPCKLGTLSTRIMTHITFVRFFTSVASFMNCKVWGIFEYFSTVVTGIIPTTS